MIDNDLLLVLGNLVDSYGFGQVLEGLAGCAGEREEHKIRNDLELLVFDWETEVFWVGVEVES